MGKKQAFIRLKVTSLKFIEENFWYKTIKIHLTKKNGVMHFYSIKKVVNGCPFNSTIFQNMYE